MTEHAFEVTPDAGVTNAATQRALRLKSQVDAWNQRLTADSARTINDVLMDYPTMTQESAALVVASGMSSDDPLLSTLARKDVEQQEEFMPFKMAKGAVRGATTFAESLWEAGVPTWGRTATRVAQGENPLTAYRKSSTSYLAEAARQGALGNPINLGSGWFPNSTQAEDQPGYYADYKRNFDRTNDMNTAAAAATAEAEDRYGTPLTQDVHDFANATLVNKTHDGQNYSSPYSVGRVMAIQVTKPDTTAFKAMSAAVDFPIRIGMDPLNPVFYEITKAMMARRAILPDADQLIRQQVRQLRREKLGIDYAGTAPEGRPVLGETWGSADADELRHIDMYEESIDQDWDRIQKLAKDDPNAPMYSDDVIDPSYTDRYGEQTYGADNPYGQHQPDMTIGEFVEEVNRQGGRRAYEDFVLEHELVHADESGGLYEVADEVGRAQLEENLANATQRMKVVSKTAEDFASNPANRVNGRVEYSDDLMKMWDEAEDAFYTAQAEFHEFVTPIVRQLEGKAQGIAMQRLFDPDYTMQGVGMRNTLQKQAGITYRWRPAVKAKQASDWIVSRQAQPVLKWLAREHRWSQIDKRFPMLPFHTKQQLAATDNAADIVELLKPYLGMEVSKTPKLGLARLGERIQFDPYAPNKGYASHEFSSGYLSRGVKSVQTGARRLRAESVPVILSPYRPNQSAQSAVEWLRTIRATDDEIESVIRMIGEASGSSSYSAMVDTYQQMTNILTSKLDDLGYTSADIKVVLDQMRHDHVVNRQYWLNYAANPLHRMDDGYKTVIAGVDEVEEVRRISAATEAQFSDSWIGLPNMRDTRRATSKMRATRENTVYGFGENNARFWNSEGTRLGLKSGIGLGVMDKTQSIWRNWMLMRFAWPVRVVGEEMLRAHAYGYGHWMSHPIDVLGQMANSEAKVSLLGDSLKDIIKLDGLGAGGWKEGDQVYDMSRVAWTAANRGQMGFESGVVTELIQLRASRLNRLVAQHGVEKVVDMVVNDTDDIGRVVRAISDRAEEGSTLQKMATDVNVLRRHLESVEAQIAQAGGGRWIEGVEQTAKLRDGTTYRIWRDMYENPIEVYSLKTKTELLVIAREQGMTGVSKLNKQDLANAVSQQVRGFDDVPYLNPDQQFIVTEAGSTEVRQLVETGNWGDNPAIWDEMTIDEVKALEENILTMYDDAGAKTPTVVRTAVQSSRDEQQMATVVDRVFEMLMQKPSTALARSPHFVTRYTEEVARMYLTAQVDQRALIVGWVAENGFERPFNRALQKMLDYHGLKHVPGDPLDAQMLANGRIRYVKLADDTEIQIVDTPLDELIEREVLEDGTVVPPPEGYAPQGGMDLRKAELDDLLVSMVDTEMQAEMLEQGVARFETGLYWAEGAGAQGDVTAPMYLREIQRRISAGEVTADEVFAAAQSIEARFRHGEDVGARMEWMWGPLDSFDDAGMVKYGGLSPEEEAIAAILTEQGIDYSPGDFYFHGSYSRAEDFDGLRQGGILENPDYAINFVDSAQDYGSPGRVFVFRRDDFPENISQHHRVERAMSKDEYDDFGGNVQWDTTVYDEFVEPVAVIEVSDIKARAGIEQPPVTPKPFPETVAVRFYSDDVLDNALQNYMAGNSEIGPLRHEIIARLKQNELGTQDVEDALSRLVRNTDLDDPAALDRLTEANLQLSGMQAELRGGVIADNTIDMERQLDDLQQAWDMGAITDEDAYRFQQLKDQWEAEMGSPWDTDVDHDYQRTLRSQGFTDDDLPFGPAGDAMPASKLSKAQRDADSRGATVTVPSMFSNRALGILTEDQQLLARIDEIAKAKAIDDTKALFYDLTRRSNFTDMARYIFPFGDAFLEQVRIWARAMTPMGEQTGQALQNWRRAQVGVTNMRKSGYFSEDEFGNEVMNWPGAGRLSNLSPLQPEGSQLGATIQPDQLMMMNLTPRGGLVPGTGPFIQTPASMMQPLLDRVPPLRDLVNWFAFGDYSPGSLATMDEALSGIAPTTVRRFVDATISERRKTEYADEINLTIEAMIESGDPRYGDDQERAPDTIRDAQLLGTSLAFFRIADGFFSPAQPRYEPQLLLELAGEDPFWMNIAALSDEYREARDFFDTESEAIEYMQNRFGVDPLTLVGATREVTPRPVTKEAYDYAQTNREFYTETPVSMMMWLPHTDLDLFYLPAHQKSIREDDRQILGQDEAMGLRQRQKGYLALSQIQETYDTMATKIDRDYNGDHRDPGWTKAMTELNRWKNMQRYDTYAMWPPVEPGATVRGVMQHPSYEDTLNEVLRVGTPGTAPNDVVREKQPDMAWWVEGFAAKWKRMEEGTILMSPGANTGTWWLTSTSPQAESLRRDAGNYFNQLTMEALARVEDPARKEEMRTQIGWFMQRVMEPLFEGYALEDEMFLFSESTPPPLLNQNQNAAIPGVMSNG